MNLDRSRERSLPEIENTAESEIAMPGAESLDPIEALRHIKTLVRVASDSDDLEAVQKVLAEVINVIDKALPKRRLQ